MNEKDWAEADRADAEDITRAANERRENVAKGLKAPQGAPWPDEKPAQR